MEKERPVFLVNIGVEGKTIAPHRLVRAKNVAKARGHVSRSIIGVKRASPSEILKLGAEGAVIEEAAE